MPLRVGKFKPGPTKADREAVRCGVRLMHSLANFSFLDLCINDPNPLAPIRYPSDIVQKFVCQCDSLAIVDLFQS